MILERQVELDAAARLLDATAAGACALLVEGEPGIGKTTLIDSAAAMAHERGFTVLRCRPSQSEVRLSHAALVELFDNVTCASIATLPATQERALMVALGREEPGEVPDQWQTVAAAVAAVFRSLADARPVLVVVDDLHWLDPASAQAIEFGVRSAHERPVAVLAAARVGEGPMPRPMERSVRPDRLWRLVLGPLSNRAVARLLDLRGGRDLRPDVVRRITRAARGNPLAALELARATEAEPPSPDAPLPVPVDVSAAVSRRLATLPARTRDALLRLACDPSAPCPDDDLDALASAELAGMVAVGAGGSVVFTHPLYESAIMALTPPAARRAMHARLATEQGDLQHRARHLALSVEGPDAEVADTLEAAALDAAARGVPHGAAELADRSWRLTPPDRADELARRGLQACELFGRAGLHAEMVQVMEDLPSLDGPLGGQVLVLAGEAQFWRGQMQDAVDLLQRALEQLADHDAGAAWAHLVMVHALHYTGADPVEILGHADLSVARASAAGEDGPLSEAIAMRAAARWRLVGGIDDEALRHAQEIADPRRRSRVQLRPGMVRAVLRGYAGHLDEAIRAIEDEIGTLSTLGNLGDIPYLAVHLGNLGAMRGDRGAVERAADMCADVAEDTGGPFARAPVGMLRANAHMFDGDLAAARRAAADAMELARTGHPAAAISWMVALLVRLELAAGDHEAGLRWAQPALERLDPNGPDPSYAFYVPDAVEALVLAGQVERARELLDPYERRCVELQRIWSRGACLRCRALIASAEGDQALASAQAEASVAALRDRGFPIELGRSLLVLGQLERRRRQRAAARAALQAAHEEFARTGAELWRRRAEDELNRTWNPSSTARLSPSELRIARLAAEGLTNPEIAARQFVSRRTVEATLTRVYRKLAVRNRSELAAALSEHVLGE